MMMPTASPTSISGLATNTNVTIASRATSSTSGPVIVHYSPRSAPPKSDRHLQDVLVGLDHAVAHRDQRLDRDLGLRYRGDHIDDVGLVGHHRLLLRIRLAAGVDHGAERVLEHRP